MAFSIRARAASLAPKSYTYLKSYSLNALQRDLGAGVTVGIVALPLAMAFAIASGAGPQVGLYTAVVAGFIISIFGGTRFQIGGPTGAFVIIIAGVIGRHGYEGLVLATILAGLLLILMGIFGMGRLLQYIPYPVTAGFTLGIGLLIFTSQLKDFFGLQISQMPSAFTSQIVDCVQAMPSFALPTFCIGTLTLAVMLMVRRFIPRIPAPFAGILIGSIAAWALGLNVETIGSRFGGIPATLPEFTPVVGITLNNIRNVLPDALSIAVLAGIESLLSATVADGMSGDRHNSSTELVAQGIANITSSLFGGLPATGAIARTATNIRAGAFSPFAGVIHALTLVMFIKFLSPVASIIPLSSLAAVLMVVAWDMSEPHRIKRLLRAPMSDSMVMLSAFGLTVFIGLTTAVEIGVVLSAILFMKRMSELVDIHSLDTGLPEEAIISRRTGHPRVVVYEISGPFFFGMTHRFLDVMRFTRKKPEILVLCMRQVPTIDATGLEGLETVIRRSQQQGIRVILSGVHPTIMKVMKRMGTDQIVGSNNIFTDFSTAVSENLPFLTEEETSVKVAMGKTAHSM